MATAEPKAERKPRHRVEGPGLPKGYPVPLPALAAYRRVWEGAKKGKAWADGTPEDLIHTILVNDTDRFVARMNALEAQQRARVNKFMREYNARKAAAGVAKAGEPAPPADERAAACEAVLDQLLADADAFAAVEPE